MSDANRFHDVALAKLSAVLGVEAANAHIAAGLGALELTHISSADELHRFSQHLVAQGGFAGAVGGLLGVHAVLHGARANR